MRITFYETMLDKADSSVRLVKERAVNYKAEKMNRPEEIARLMCNLLHMDRLAEERCYMIALNNSLKALGICFISKGTANASLVSPRELYIRALLMGAVQIIICHNHPSGNAVPTETDIELTNKIKEAGKLINVNLADHIVIGGDSYFSFREAELL